MSIRPSSSKTVQSGSGISPWDRQLVVDESAIAQRAGVGVDAAGDAVGASVGRPVDGSESDYPPESRFYPLVLARG